MCLAAGCPKAVEFRNLGKTSLSFDYTLWAKDLRDPANEVKDTGTTSVGSENTTTVSGISGGDLVRVAVRMR
jgi:hypothetical protein